MDADQVPTNSLLAGLLVLVIRGLLLWLVVPLALVTWPLVYIPLHRRSVTVGQFLGWTDLNLCALLQRSLLRPITRYRAEWWAVSELPDVVHRISWTDPI